MKSNQLNRMKLSMNMPKSFRGLLVPVLLIGALISAACQPIVDTRTEDTPAVAAASEVEATAVPTVEPTEEPTAVPTAEPTAVPTAEPAQEEPAEEAASAEESAEVAIAEDSADEDAAQEATAEEATESALGTVAEAVEETAETADEAADEATEEAADEAPAEVEPTEVEPTEVEPTEVEPTEVEPAEVEPADAEAEVVEDMAEEDAADDEAADDEVAEEDAAEETASTEAASETEEAAEEEPATGEESSDAGADDAGTDAEPEEDTGAQILLEPATATIATRSLRVRAEPNEESEVVAGAREGESYPVIAMSTDGAWVQIEIERSESGLGWVSTNFISLEGDITETETAPVVEPEATPEPTAAGEVAGPTATVNTRSLVVRAEPVEDSEVIAGLALGDVFDVLGISPDGVWLQLALPEVEGEAGWVQATFVRLAGDLTAIPTIGEVEEEPVTEGAADEDAADEDGAAGDESAPATIPTEFTTATINTRSLFVRALPDAESDPVTGAREGEVYDVIELSADGEWVHIEISRSETGEGWVAAEFVILE